VPSVARLFGKHRLIPIPPEFTDETTLLAYLSLGPKELQKIWWYRHQMYTQFEIAKGKGKFRIITAPDKRLKILQSKLSPLLDQIYRVRNPVHGFVIDRSVKTNAMSHGRRWHVINLDLRDFFPTITENRVYGLLRSVGVGERVAEIIARVCCCNGQLPQGAPTSPVLSNMICYRLDSELLRIAKSARAIYTRYADDITFSAYQPPSPLFQGALPATGRFSPEILAPAVTSAFKGNGFTIHPDKAHYADRNSRRIVTGVKINAGLNVDRRYVRNVRAIMHSIQTIGLPAAQKKHEDGGGKGNLEALLRGKISYIAHLKGQPDPVVRSLALRYNNCFPARPIKLTPTVGERRDRSVWVIETDTHHGTAFFLKDIGLVTAEHCVEGADSVEILHPGKHATKFAVKVLKRHKHRDLAILDHSGIPEIEYFELEPAMGGISVGASVTAYGYPSWAPGDRLNERPGYVSLLTPKSGVQMIEVTQQLAQGMSGGPILDAQGKVVGVIHKGGPGEGRQLAVNLSVLWDWLAE
jgi:RNA-directed DNA polymerase